jgi:lipopolysaccharide transport system permease protein
MQGERPSLYLLSQLLRRDLAARYRGSLLGILWALLTPLLMLAVYSFVFGVIFRARFDVPQAQEENIAFPLLLYSGLIIHQFAAETLNRATTIILQHANYVKKVVFPLVLLPVVVLGSALVMMLIQWALLLVAMALTGHAFSFSALLLPLILLPLVFMLQGAAWIAASVGVFLRDLSQVMTFLTTILLFLSPVFYPVSALPEAYQQVMQLNPLTPMIENARAVLFFHTMPDWTSLIVCYVIGILLLLCGYVWFTRTRKGFNDVV